MKSQLSSISEQSEINSENTRTALIHVQNQQLLMHYIRFPLKKTSDLYQQYSEDIEQQKRTKMVGLKYHKCNQGWFQNRQKLIAINVKQIIDQAMEVKPRILSIDQLRKQALLKQKKQQVSIQQKQIRQQVQNLHQKWLQKIRIWQYEQNKSNKRQQGTQQTKMDIILQLQSENLERNECKLMCYTQQTYENHLQYIERWQKVHCKMKELLEKLLQMILAKTKNRNTIYKNLINHKNTQKIKIDEQSKFMNVFRNWFNSLYADQRQLELIKFERTKFAQTQTNKLQNTHKQN